MARWTRRVTSRRELGPRAAGSSRRDVPPRIGSRSLHSVDLDEFDRSKRRRSANSWTGFVNRRGRGARPPTPTFPSRLSESRPENARERSARRSVLQRFGLVVLDRPAGVDAAGLALGVLDLGVAVDAGAPFDALDDQRHVHLTAATAYVGELVPFVARLGGVVDLLRVLPVVVRADPLAAVPTDVGREGEFDTGRERSGLLLCLFLAAHGRW